MNIFQIQTRVPFDLRQNQNFHFLKMHNHTAKQYTFETIKNIMQYNYPREKNIILPGIDYIPKTKTYLFTFFNAISNDS